MLLTAETGSGAAVPAALFKLCFGCWSANGTRFVKTACSQAVALCGAERAREKCVKFGESEWGSQNVELLCVSVVSCV